jgi:predicted TIM-barrel fold metal-dependent hydrolase
MDAFNAEERVLIVSSDAHVGPSQAELRPFCSTRYLPQFDEAAALIEQRKEQSRLGAANELALGKGWGDAYGEAVDRAWNCAGSHDPAARHRDMDAEGVAADVLYGGGQNGNQMPFSVSLDGLGGLKPSDARLSDFDPDLEREALEIWNRWQADFISSEPARHVGLMQLPLTFDLEATIPAMTRAREAGLTAVNFPAPRADFPAYNEESVYEDFWSACEDLDLPLCTHIAGGERPLGSTGVGGGLVIMAENPWMARRSLWQMIFGGVFERHPRLKLVFTEQRSSWVRETLRDLDSIYSNELWNEHRNGRLPRTPSEYFAANCSVAASMMAAYEVDERHDVGVDRLMWGGDYPHSEGCWPRSQLSIRFAFANSDADDDEFRAILGENAVRIFNLDRAALRTVADRIGPTISEIRNPVPPSEVPEFRGFAFREHGMYA